MQKNKWNTRLDWVKSGSTSPYVYYQQYRNKLYDENKYIAVGDIYFRLNKYLTGVTFTYITNLDNIYNMGSLMTGDGYSLVNMYNEYDVIDRTMKNLAIVDAAADTNIDIDFQWFEINGVKLIPGHLVLLKNQNNEAENDIYLVDNQYFLNNAGILSSRDKSEKFSCVVKLGKNADKQFFLVNNGLTFPISFEPKKFIEGKSYILKNLIQYNLLSDKSSGSTSKMIFTDYEFARKQLDQNVSRYYGFTASGISLLDTPSNYLTIKYHHDSYTIRSGTSFDESFTGLTNSISNLISGYTYIPKPIDFNPNIGDYIYLDMYSGSTIHLQLNTYVKNIQNDYIVLEDTIPNYILTDLKNCSFYIENNNVATSWTGATRKMSLTPYSDFFEVSGFTYTNIIEYTDIKFTPIEYIYDKYFDYDGFKFYFNDSVNYNYFFTPVHYLKYNLYDRLNDINSGFTSDFKFFNETIISGSTFNSYLYTDDSRIKITTNLSGVTDIFKPYTYVNLSGDAVTTEKTLVYSVTDHEIVVEKPNNWTAIYPTQSQLPIVTSIQNIDGLKNISDFLYEVYMNQTFDWYIKKSDNERKYIAKSYAELLQKNSFFRKNITGLLYENKNNEYILKLYDIVNDSNLIQYESIELIYVGSDKKTRLPVPLVLTGATIDDSLTFILEWNVLDGGLDDSLDGSISVIGDLIDAGIDNVIPGISDPPLVYNLIDGGLDNILQ